MATMGERIKQLRKENGWTQTELAAKLDVTKGTVSTWETDSRRPGFDKLDQLCDLFDRSMDYVSGLSDTPGHSRITREEAFDLMLSVDVSDEKRLGACAALRAVSKKTAQIDHHPTNPLFMDINSVDGDAPAACGKTERLPRRG